MSAWVASATAQASGVVVLTRDPLGVPAGVAMLDEDGRVVQIFSRDVAVAVALRLAELSTLFEEAA